MLFVYESMNPLPLGPCPAHAAAGGPGRGVAVYAEPRPQPHATEVARVTQPALVRGGVVFGVPHPHRRLHRQPHRLPHHSSLSEAAGDRRAAGKKQFQVNERENVRLGANPDVYKEHKHS